MNEKIRCLKEQLKQLNIEGMIVSNPVSIKYLTNIDVEGVLLITRRESNLSFYYLQSYHNKYKIKRKTKKGE